jgi:hypothetical protein
MSNKLVGAAGGGIENVAEGLNVNEMLIQSHDGVIRIFPCWPKDMPARFTDLRAVGAFLVSAVKKDDAPTAVRIVSEKGSPCTIVNPWPGKRVVVYRRGAKAETLSGNRFTFETTAGEDIQLGPGK